VSGRVESIHISAKAGATPYPVDSIAALTGRGLEGDRNTAPADAWSPTGCAITLIEAEAIEAVNAEHGIDLSNGRTRRQVMTRGIDLNALVGLEFTVGEVRCRGVELCEPCRHLESLTEPGVITALVHRGGLRADILQGGSISVGDDVRAV
jgi:MOSC domain-containing protein YiiM